MASKLTIIRNLFTTVCKSHTRSLSISRQLNANVAVVGAAGNIGQPLSLLLKYNPMVTNLSIYDITDVSGQRFDLSHIDTSTHMVPVLKGDLLETLEHADVVVVPAGLPRKPGMTRDDLLEKNAQIIYQLMLAIKKVGTCPTMAIVTNPVNSIIPFMYEFMSSENNPAFFKNDDERSDFLQNKIIGVSTLDCVRASTFYAEHLGRNPSEIIVPVVGGHSDTTMVPLFSMSSVPLEDEAIAAMLTKKVREAGTKVVEAKNGKGSASLSMAYAANRLVNSILEAMHGKKIVECAYIHSIVHPELKYFAEMCIFTPIGAEETVPFEDVSPYEKQLLKEIVAPLKADIEKGVTLAQKYIKRISEEIPPSESTRLA